MLFSGKIRFHDVARLTARCVLFASIFHYTPLFETIRTIRYLLFGFPDTHRDQILGTNPLQRLPGDVFVVIFSREFSVTTNNHTAIFKTPPGSFYRRLVPKDWSVPCTLPSGRTSDIHCL